MDLTKLPNEKKLNLCMWYFRVGFAFLPFVWAVNAIWFFNEAFRKPEYPEQKQIKKYVIFSALGALLWLIILVSWITVFQLNRSSWGAFADQISFIIPLGTP
ncbi:gamma-secretase subunit pen-2 [Anthonomus grandis grandis]|uniref:gamma-secretase subunit pen-2 n=1 Tax=Anthonomus grandis grandis TaxID=2921223 RepID=UPI002165F892|nr:gamma-secretase subunit pen-2 [Anthonomus grandis grandis]